MRTRQPDDFNGYGYFFVRLYCTGLGFQANIVEEYGLLTALQHILAGLKRTRDQKLSSGWMMSGQLNFAPLGVGLKFRRDSRGSPQVLQVYFASNVVQS